MCNVTGGVPSWRVNGRIYSLNGLFTGQLARHNISGVNIIVEDIMMNDIRNGSVYICVMIQIPPMPDIESEPTILYVAGKLNEIHKILLVIQLHIQYLLCVVT